MSFSGPEFKKLKAKWDAKLAKSGFVDIETEHGLKRDRISTESAILLGHRQDLADDIQNYYEWACLMLHEGSFKSSIDKKIWKLHSEGKTQREIEAIVQVEQSWICRKLKTIKQYLGRGF